MTPQNFCKPFEENDLADSNAREFFDRHGFRILRALRALIHVADSQSHNLKHRFHITGPQLICLYCLERIGPMTLSALAREVSLGASTTTGIVDRLVAKGFVERTRGLVDHRKVDLKITLLGREIARMAPTLLQDKFLDALHQLPESEVSDIALALEKVVELMRPRSDATKPQEPASGGAKGIEPRQPLERTSIQ